ncbi:MAG: response regulator [Desulfobacteraceae bacterium]|nr:MAG: response regulator [Desulfobacteraceae bacterium]
MTENKNKIMVVDDDRISREMVGNALTKYQYDVDMTENVQTAMERILECNYAVIITDKNMPDTQGGDQGGMEILKYAKMHLPATEVIIITAFGSIESAIESMKNGAFDYIAKPLDPKELKEKIERILDYRSFINPKNTISIYRTLHNAVLTLIQNQGKPTVEDPHQALKEIDKTIDHFFRAQKEWERVLLIQKEALGNIAAYAEQLKGTVGENSSQQNLLEKICNEASKRI